jgi:hypothetical protein
MRANQPGNMLAAASPNKLVVSLIVELNFNLPRRRASFRAKEIARLTEPTSGRFNSQYKSTSAAVKCSWGALWRPRHVAWNFDSCVEPTPHAVYM